MAHVTKQRVAVAAIATCVEQVLIAGDPRDALATSSSAVNDAG